MQVATTLNSTDQRALELLGAGVSTAQTALAIGVSESRIAQLLSDDDFSGRLAERRFASLAKHNARDEEYDQIEDQLIKQLKTVLPLVIQPEKIARLLQVVNQAKRRGASSPDNIVQKQTVIKLQLPVQIINKFSTNSSNQVVTVHDGVQEQSMVTVQSGQMKKLAAVHKEQEDAIRSEHVREARVLNKFGLG
jgi:hypothetical protein